MLERTTVVLMLQSFISSHTLQSLRHRSAYVDSEKRQLYMCGRRRQPWLNAHSMPIEEPVVVRKQKKIKR
jgi:hypothetical protein